jgi:membrane-bound lytic murein transglycosylase B
VRRRAGRAIRTPAFGIVALTPLVFAGAVGASSPSPSAPVRNSAITPMAAVAPSAVERSGAAVVAVTRPPTALHIATANVSAPPPALVVNSPGALRIPTMALDAYRNAERMMAAAYPSCGVSWNLLAGIGRIESMHANGGATDARGTAVRPIFGPALDGTLPGNQIIVQSRTADRVVYARALGPMQFLPGTWSRYASDGDGDGKADVQNLFDSSLAAARYLCSGGLNLRDQSQVMTAVLRYNNSVAYARNVLGWAGAYATGVVPVDLPPITAPIPSITARVAAIGDPHLDNYQGLGPDLPLNATGLPANDPLALVPVMRRTDVASRIPNTNVPGFAAGQTLGPLPGPPPEVTPTPLPQQPPPWLPPWMQPQQPQCVVFCLGQLPSPAAPPEALPPGIGAPQGAPADPPPAPPPFVLPPLFPPPPPPAPLGPPPGPPLGPLGPLGPPPGPPA